MRLRSLALAASILVASLLAVRGTAAGQLDLPRKVKERVKNDMQGVEQKIDKGAEESTGADSAHAKAAGTPTSNAGQVSIQVTPLGETAYSEDMRSCVNFDFVPGDSALFIDDFSGDSVGAAPWRWETGTDTPAVEMSDGRRVVPCGGSSGGSMSPKLSPGGLPPRYTVEVEIDASDARGYAQTYCVSWIGEDSAPVGGFSFHAPGPDSSSQPSASLWFGRRSAPLGEHSSQALARLARSWRAGRHVLRISTFGGSVKCYVDHELVASDTSGSGFRPATLRVGAGGGRSATDREAGSGRWALTEFRLRAGKRPLREQLEKDGRAVARGILFDPDSAKIKAESFRTLADLARLMSTDKTLRVSIEAHADGASGSEEATALSQRRADSVRTYLIETYKIEAGRLSAKGWGSSKPIDGVETPEGRANNLRVEIVRL